MQAMRSPDRLLQILVRLIDVFGAHATDARNLVIGPRTGLVDPFDGVAELWVESIEALEDDWSTEKAKEYIEIFFKDEQNFIDWTRSTILVSKENIVMP